MRSRTRRAFAHSRTLGWIAAISLSAAPPMACHAEGTLQLDAPTLFKRVQTSATQRSYAGTYVVSANGAMASSRVLHYCNGQEQIDKIESLDGQMRRIYRHNDVVHVLWPQNHQASIEPRDLMGRLLGPGSAVARPGAAASAAASTSASPPSDAYEVQMGKEDRVAGYEAQVVNLKPRDPWRYGQRWWLERDTGLLLRSDLLGPKGEVLESAGFSELQIGVKLQPQQLLQEMHRLQGYKILQPQFTRTSLEQEGWALKRAVPGFKPYACVRRAAPQTPGTTASVKDGPHGMLQAIYTDGLTHVSMFIEPYDAARHSTDNPAVLGATRVHARRDGDWWVTTVGEVPAATLQAFSQGLERLKP